MKRQTGAANTSPPSSRKSTTTLNKSASPGSSTPSSGKPSSSIAQAAKRLARHAHLGQLALEARLFVPELMPLLAEVVEIERGRRAGNWALERGRLWVVAG